MTQHSGIINSDWSVTAFLVKYFLVLKSDISADIFLFSQKRATKH